MNFFRHPPIERKLTLITMMTTCLALLLASVAFVTYEWFVFRAGLIEEHASTAMMVGVNSTAALYFRDPQSAAQTLASLRADPDVTGAAIYEPDGKLFAVYDRADGKTFVAPPVRGDSEQFRNHVLGIYRVISLGGEKAGTVYLECTLDKMQARLWRYALIVAGVLAAASLLALPVSRKLQASISGPISHLAGVVSAVAANQDYEVRAVPQGEAELGSLIDGFNLMLDQVQLKDQALHEGRENLEKRVEARTEELSKEIFERKQTEKELARTHDELLDASRRAGMAEVATNVLHNVGNVLNSVNVSASLVSEHLKRSKVTDLPRLVALLAEHEADLATFMASDPRGRHVPTYLAKLTQHLLAEQQSCLGELDSLRNNVEHIKDIVSMQQSYAKVSGVREIIDVVDLVEDSLRMNAGALSRHGVDLTRDYAEVPPLNVDKHKVLQILINLVRNAKYACGESGRSDKRMTLRVANGDGSVCISVGDNGIGIPAESLTRIFNHGFTTREQGHGFGLHSAALAAQEMGGTLSVQSDGTGHGACFTLELPVQLVEVAA